MISILDSIDDNFIMVNGEKVQVLSILESKNVIMACHDVRIWLVTKIDKINEEIDFIVLDKNFNRHESFNINYKRNITYFGKEFFISEKTEEFNKLHRKKYEPQESVD